VFDGGQQIGRCAFFQRLAGGIYNAFSNAVPAAVKILFCQALLRVSMGCFVAALNMIDTGTL